MFDVGTGGRWKPVGVDALVRTIRATLDDPDVGLVLLTGPAGIGKTALAQEVLTEVEAEGRRALRAVASLATADWAYGALGPLLQVDAEGATPTNPRVGGIDRRDGEPRLLLVIDDLPLLDPASAAEVARLVRSGDVVVLATARAGTPLPAAVDGLDVEGRVRTRTLAPLTAAQLAAAAEAALGAPLTDDALRAVLDRSGGVPLHARELIGANVDAGHLVSTDGRWSLAGQLQAPPTLFDLVASRFLRLGQADRRSVEALCLVQPLPLDAATTLVGLDVLIELEQGEVITVQEEGGTATVRLAHPLYEESIRSRLQPLRRRAAAEQAVDALREAAVGDDDLAYRLAGLRLDHQLPLAPDEALAAAQRALGLLDPARAEQFIEAAADRSAGALLLLGAARAALGRTDEADAVLSEAWDAATTDELRARVLSRRTGTLGPGAGRFEEAARLLAEGLEQIEDPRWRAFLETDLAYLRSWAGKGPEVVATPDETTSPEVRANECLVGSIMAALAGEVTVAEQLVTEGLTIVSTIERDVPHARDMLVLSRFLALAFGGRAAEAHALSGAELAEAQRAASGGTGVWLAVRSLYALVDGDTELALAEAAGAVDHLILGDVAGLRPLALSVRAVAHARRGEVAESEAAAAAIDASWRDEVKVQLHLTQAAAWQEIAAGHRSSAVDLLVEAGQIGLQTGHLPLGAFAAYDAVRLGEPAAVLDLIREITDRWEGPMAQAVRNHTELLARDRRPLDHDLAALTELAERLPGLGLGISAVCAWEQVATAAEAQGADDALRRARRALALALAPLRDLVTPLRVRPKLLTDRELEVASAVADGRTSKEVADLLGRSVRTVDNHLAAVYRKLGVTSRQELAPLLEQLRAVTPPEGLPL